MAKLLFVVSVVALITVCTSIGAYAGFYLSSNWYTAVEPIVYPCPYPGNAGTCMQHLNRPPSRGVGMVLWLAFNGSHPYSLSTAEGLCFRLSLP